ncbi:MAG: hypothetical protein QOE34_1432, partial [Verrucomicrobiota bacterium]|jgi:hypothetical protein
MRKIYLMYRIWHRVLTLSLAAFAVLCLIPQRADAVSYGVNLIVNGNAESGSSSATGNPVSVPGWTTSASFTVIPYNAAGGYPTSGGPGPPDRLNQFFSGGNAATSTATQVIDLSANAADINQGNVIFDLSGYFGGFSSDNDNARLSATFFNGTTSLGLATVGHVTGKDRGSTTGLLLRRGSGIVPVNTTRVVLTQTMTRVSGSSNDGYADSLSFVCSLKAGSQTTAETFAGNGTKASATGPWSDPAHWSSAQVPNNVGNNFFDVTITGLALSGKLSDEDRIITRRFGAVTLDISATVSNLTLIDAGLTNDGFTFSGENMLTVTGTTTDLSSQNQTSDDLTQTPGFTVQTRAGDADAILSLGHFTNFSGNTLSSTRLTLFAQGPAATVQFNGADIVTLGGVNTSVTLTGSNAHIIDEIGNDALRHLTVIGTGAALNIGALDFVTGGNLTINGGLGLNDYGLNTSFTVTGSLTNFDSATKTLTGGSITVRDDISGTANVIFRFNGADIVNNASSLSLNTPTARIVDQNGLDAFRNLTHNLAAGSVSFTDHNFTSTGAFTNDGSLSVNGQGFPTLFAVNGTLTNFDPATRTLTGGVFRLFGSSSNASATATLRFNGADIVHNAADLTLGGGGTIIDQASNSGLRNFVDNTKAGIFTLLGQSFAAPSDFTNAGAVFLSNFDPSQVFSVGGGHSYIQTGGETSLGDSVMTAANVLIQGGIIHHGGTINGNVSVSRGTIAPTSGGGGGVADLGGFIIVVPGSYLIPGPDNMTINGSLTLGADAHYSMVIRSNTAGEFDTMNVSGAATFGGTLDVSLINGFVPQPGDSFTVLTAGPTITGAFINAANGGRFPTSDGRGSFIATYSDNHLVLSNFQTKPPDQLVNISTRMRVLTGDNVLIAGFIITGNDPKKVIIRGIGPSLVDAGIQGVLPDPTLELHQGNTIIATNNNWKINDQTQQSQEAAIRATTIPPRNDLESALIATLNPGTYTAILADRNQTTGIGVVEVYDLDQSANSKLANISTRGFVDTDDNAMIGGFIVGGSGGGAARVIIRARGPSLPLTGTLPDPTMELHDGNGMTIATNDNWKDSQQLDIQATTIPPPNDLDAAIVRTLVPGNYTAVVRGTNNSTGIALIEVYNLQ